MYTIIGLSIYRHFDFLCAFGKASAKMKFFKFHAQSEAIGESQHTKKTLPISQIAPSVRAKNGVKAKFFIFLNWCAFSIFARVAASFCPPNPQFCVRYAQFFYGGQAAAT